MNFSVPYRGIVRGPKGKGWRWWFTSNPYGADWLPRSKTVGGVEPSRVKARAALYAHLKKRADERARIEALAKAAADKKVGSLDRFDEFRRKWNAAYCRSRDAAMRQSKVLR